MSIEKDINITTEIFQNVIILSVEIAFSEWLQLEIDKRGWTWNRLATNANLSSGTIYNIRDGTRGVGEDSLTAIAYALKLPPEEVFRAAKMLPAKPTIDPADEELLYLFDQLTEEEQEEVLAYARMRLERQNQKNAQTRPSQRISRNRPQTESE